ncbi:MAG: TIGR00730 family Rossman fold protein [Vicinamibacterales bacterium]
MRSLCVFCGSSTGSNPAFADAARTVGASMAARGLRLVYGGGNIGLMGIVADAVLEAGGQVTGVIPRPMVEREIAHTGLTDLHIVETMHERKAMMAELSDGFVAMPGGFGTLEEIAEAITWTQLGVHEKPCGLLNVDGFYDGLLTFLAHAGESGFIRPAGLAIVISNPDPAQLLDQLEAWTPAERRQWLRVGQT